MGCRTRVGPAAVQRPSMHCTRRWFPKWLRQRWKSSWLFSARIRIWTVRLKRRDKMSDCIDGRTGRKPVSISLTRPELERLAALNAAYRDKFGFPFLYAVRGATKDDILNALEKRLLATREAELEEALRQVYRIARFRLEDLFS